RSSRSSTSSSRSARFSSSRTCRRGSSRTPLPRSSSSSSRRRSLAIMSSRRSASTCCTMPAPFSAGGALERLRGDGLVARVDIAAEPGLELAQAQVLHLVLQVPRFHRERPETLRALVRVPVQVLRVDQQTEREALAVRLDDVLVAGHGAASDLRL